MLLRMAPLTQDSRPAGSGSSFRLKYPSNDNCAMLLEEHGVNRLPAVKFHSLKYLLVEMFHVFYLVKLSQQQKF